MSQKLFQENKLRKIGWIIAVGNIVMMLFSANYFLNMAKFPIVPWLFFNACFPSTLIFLIQRELPAYQGGDESGFLQPLFLCIIRV